MTELTHIVYAEDDPDIQAIGKMVLETIGNFNVTVCDNGVQVLEALNQSTPHLILLDRMMPGLDGPATVQAIGELTQSKNIPIIFITASAQNNEIAAYLKEGVIGIIAKPFEPTELCDTIKRIWNNHMIKPAS